jgi:hypothetical protein
MKVDSKHGVPTCKRLFPPAPSGSNASIRGARPRPLSTRRKPTTSATARPARGTRRTSNNPPPAPAGLPGEAHHGKTDPVGPTQQTAARRPGPARGRGLPGRQRCATTCARCRPCRAVHAGRRRHRLPGAPPRRPCAPWCRPPHENARARPPAGPGAPHGIRAGLRAPRGRHRPGGPARAPGAGPHRRHDPAGRAVHVAHWPADARVEVERPAEVEWLLEVARQLSDLVAAQAAPPAPVGDVRATCTLSTTHQR